SSRKILRQFGGEPPHSRLLGVEQSNTSILYGDKLLLKLYRRTEEGLHPDLEIVRYLTQKAGFQHIPPYAGAIEYRRPGREALVVGLMQEFVPNQGDAWQYSLDALDHYFDRILALDPADGKVSVPGRSVLTVALEEPGESVFERVGGLYLEMTGLLGRRTAELHLALAEGRREPGFVPEPFSMLYQRGVFQSMLNQTRQGFRTLREMAGRLPGHLQEEAGQTLKLERTVVGIMRSLLKEKIDAAKIRIHGDYHLGQVLYTGKDFVIFDFEGEPARSLSERRLKRSPVRDVAGMIRSFHYAAYTALHHTAAGREDVLSQLDPWAEYWYLQVSGAFLRGYLDTAQGSRIIPKEHSQLERMLSAYLLEKAVYELGYELNNRPEWVGIPLRGIRYLCTAFREEQRS
ncbi:MAG: putative maltokinase, partial [Desulfohalobiaceae bacterium]